MPTLVPRHFRTHQAIQFVESFSETVPTQYYFYIGKTYPYANTIQITGTVKTNPTSNNIVGTGTLFTTELSVGDRLGITDQSNIVVVHSIPNAQTIVVTPRPSEANTTGANAYIRKTWSEQYPPDPVDDFQTIYYDIWRNIISLKRVTQTDVTHVMARYNWTSGTVYSEYDDLDSAIHSKQYYVYTDNNNVYKCIDNNRNSASTVKPTGTSTGIIGPLADGYRWKFIYNISSGEVLKYRTANYIPVKTLTANDASSQWLVQSTASNGAISHIKVLANGSNYMYSTNLFADVTSTTKMKLQPSANGVDGTYVGSALYISEGDAATQIRKIVKYWGANNTLIVNSAFTTLPTTSSRYIISPLVTIRGDSGGTEASRASAYVSNAYAGQIRRIRMIEPGYSYSTANVTISANHGFGGVARPIIPPIGGHGKDPVSEFEATAVMASVTVTGSESNTFTTNNDFRIIGLMRDPVLANGTIATASVIDQTTRINIELGTGDWIEDEIVIGSQSQAKGRVVYFANTNAARTEGIVKLTRVTRNGTGGNFRAGEIITGLTSSVTANVVSVTPPALKPYSGLIIYTENREPVYRDPVQAENYKFVVSY